MALVSGLSLFFFYTGPSRDRSKKSYFRSLDFIVVYSDCLSINFLPRYEVLLNDIHIFSEKKDSEILVALLSTKFWASEPYNSSSFCYAFLINTLKTICLSG